MLRSIPGLCPRGASSSPPLVMTIKIVWSHFQKAPWEETKCPPVMNHCFIVTPFSVLVLTIITMCSKSLLLSFWEYHLKRIIHFITIWDWLLWLRMFLRFIRVITSINSSLLSIAKVCSNYWLHLRFLINLFIWLFSTFRRIEQVETFIYRFLFT